MKKAKWIWLSCDAQPDSYGEFYQKFQWDQGETLCRISCDSDYTLFINGNYVSSWQYGDYPQYKVYDEINITSYLNNGENHFAVLAWHYGVNFQRHIASPAGVLFEIVQGDKILLASDEKVICRQSPSFANGKQKWITPQLGFSFAYDATKEDAWKMGTMTGGHCAVIVDKACQMVRRPIAKNLLLPAVECSCVIADRNYHLIDLRRETVGVPYLCFTSDYEQNLLIQWGEDLQNGHVRRIIGERDFSFHYHAKSGQNDFTNHMLRMGCRYIEVYSEKPIYIDYVGICPTPYSVEVKPVNLLDPLDQKIYDTCVRTLQLCMMDRYVDTPWREQCLYAFDARNQMLCGYYAFADGNAQFAKAALKLISQDQRSDGLLSINYPCGIDLTIPSFSLQYFRAVREYGEYTGDWDLVKEVYPKLNSILDTFITQMKNDLVCRFAGKNHWNFYDWSKYLEGNLFEDDAPIPDLIINCLFIIACRDMAVISERIGAHDRKLDVLISRIQKAVKNTFFCSDKGLFSVTQSGHEFTVLGNAYAILAGLTDQLQAVHICSKFNGDDMVDCTLSMKCFQYDAMLLTDKTLGKEIIAEIRKVYGQMLLSDATSVWETAEGATAFENAGSLCHGWSAIPICYYHRLQKA